MHLLGFGPFILGHPLLECRGLPLSFLRRGELGRLFLGCGVAAAPLGIGRAALSLEPLLLTRLRATDTGVDRGWICQLYTCAEALHPCTKFQIKIKIMCTCMYRNRLASSFRAAAALSAAVLEAMAAWISGCRDASSASVLSISTCSEAVREMTPAIFPSLKELWASIASLEASSFSARLNYEFGAEAAEVQVVVVGEHEKRMGHRGKMPLHELKRRLTVTTTLPTSTLYHSKYHERGPWAPGHPCPLPIFLVDVRIQQQQP